ncbi:MAG: hypothetical protein ACRDIF_01320 [Actinomycetota bacterium]
MARVLDTTPTFEAFARKAFSQGPLIREMMCEESYHSAYPEVFQPYFQQFSKDGLRGVVWELSQVRSRAKEGAEALPKIIEEVEPKVAELLGLHGLPQPRHVLMVGSLATNASVGRVGGEVAVFHCLEWFQGPGPAKVLVAHEDAHAWHEISLGEPPPGDLAWNAFYEGIAIQASRQVVPDRPEVEYFWYGVAGFENWLPWCREHRDDLLARFAEALDDPGASEAFFGGGSVEGKWRVGYFVADQLLAAIDRPLEEVIRMGFEEGRETIRAAVKGARTL